jgi:hypothetical protein
MRLFHPVLLAEYSGYRVKPIGADLRLRQQYGRQTGFRQLYSRNGVGGSG